MQLTLQKFLTQLLTQPEKLGSKWQGFTLSKLNGVVAQNPRCQTSVAELNASLAELGLGATLKATQLKNYVNLNLTGYHNHTDLNEYLQLVISRLKNTEPVKSPTHLVDYCGANAGKVLHWGNVRSIIVGDVIRRLLISQGHAVTSDVHFGDGTLNLALLIYGLITLTDLKPKNQWTISYLHEIYVLISQKKAAGELNLTAVEEVGLKIQKASILGIPSDFQTEVDLVRKLTKLHTADILTKLNAQINLWLGEMDSFRTCQYVVDLLLKKQIAKYDDGAVIIDFKDHGQPALGIMIIQKRTGAYLYATTDLATLYDRITAGLTHIYYVADQRQALHFKQVFYVFNQLLNYEHIHLRYVGFGLILGKNQLPLKTRLGGTAVDWNQYESAHLRCLDVAHNSYKNYVLAPDAKSKWPQLAKATLVTAELTTTQKSNEAYDTHLLATLASAHQIKAILELTERTLVVNSIYNLLEQIAFNLNELGKAPLQLTTAQNSALTTAKLAANCIQLLLGLI